MNSSSMVEQPAVNQDDAGSGKAIPWESPHCSAETNFRIVGIVFKGTST